ncbi:MAG: aminotransferase class V-fold PLP-dependent enzyme [Anaerolineae bacterium]|jgi:glutamate/tyrosine decarboxylase-like PLP-dependent enzyme|nr:aminotransferase class V-fold PLP-dependent enzyme [Anaerolineae bacterium]
MDVLNPEQFRALGYRAIDMIAQQLADLADGPTRRPVPLDVRHSLEDQPIPETGADPFDLLDRVQNEVLAYPMGNPSPRFFAWVNSTPTPIGILGDLFAAAMSPSAAGGDQAATYVERAALTWVKDMLGFPQEAQGLFVSGGSKANLTCLAVMRHVMSEGKVRADGMASIDAPMIVYTSAHGHSCIEKAISALGIGSKNLRIIPVDSQHRMDVEKLREAIAADRAAGLHPVCVAASAGTTNTGAIDQLDVIADLCEAENMWFHIDGAYGGFGILAEQTEGMYKGMNRADSIAVDPHKWLYIPVECGCAIVRHAEAMRATFSLVPAYLQEDRAEPWFSEYGLQQTRGFRALKVWLSIQHYGLDGYRKMITQDINTAYELRRKLFARSDYEVVTAGPLSVTCFRYVPAGVPEEQLDDLQRQIVAWTNASARAFITTTMIDGKTVVRACHVNFRTTSADLDVLLDTLTEAGQLVLQGAQQA